MRIRNLTNSPYDIPSLNGPVHLPVGGEVTGDFDPAYLDAIRVGCVVEVIEDEAPADPPAAEDAPAAEQQVTVIEVNDAPVEEAAPVEKPKRGRPRKAV